MGKIVTNVYDEISEEAYDYFYDAGGKYLADFWYQKVHNGDITKDELDERVRILKIGQTLNPRIGVILKMVGDQMDGNSTLALS